MGFIPDNIFLNLAIIAACFVVLAKSADFLVEGAVGIAYGLQIPKIIVGIVLVGFMTTAPEFAVSVISSLQGQPEIALGNAVGSVIVDDALALALGIVVAPVAITVNSRVLRTTGFFLIGIDVLTFVLSLNGNVGRPEGIVLLAILAAYLTTVVVFEGRRRGDARRRPGSTRRGREDTHLGREDTHRGREDTHRGREDTRPRTDTTADSEADEYYKPASVWRQVGRFAIGIAGVLVASEFLVHSAEFTARFAGVPPVVIGLTLVAIGTSIPEVATCIVAARKGHGDLAFGDILGADILNILWIVGTSATVNPLSVGKRVIYFSFPAMLIVVITMLVFARIGHRLERWKGIVLIILYLAYLTATIMLFYT